MKEFWETVKSIKTQTSITINYEVSNKGNVRLSAFYNEQHIATYHLSLGKGLYVNYDSYPNIQICRCGGDVYRYVYFMKRYNHEYKKGYQIHHLDYNHCNNNIDNLIYCSAKEHGKYHGFMLIFENNKYYDNSRQLTELEQQQLEQYNKALEYYKWLEDNKETFSIDNSLKYYKQIREEIEELAKPYIEEDRKIRAEQLIDKRKKKKEQDRLDKLNSGKYIEIDGKLHKLREPWTAERREKTMKTRREKCYNNPEWRANVSKGVKEWVDKQPNFAEEVSIRMTKVMSDPEMREHLSQTSKAWWEKQKSLNC